MGSKALSIEDRVVELEKRAAAHRAWACVYGVALIIEAICLGFAGLDLLLFK
jgi:hypothetical protein